MSTGGNGKASAGYYMLISQWHLGKIFNQNDIIKITKKIKYLNVKTG